MVDSKNEIIDPLLRKHYRTAMDCIKRIDQNQLKKTQIGFAIDAKLMASRNQLRTSCEYLIFNHSLLYGKRAEDMLWNKCVYEPITALRNNKQKLKDHERSMAKLVLSAASGNLHSLIVRLATIFQIQTEIIISLPKIDSKSEEIDKDNQNWAKNSIHRLIVYLGDIARYTNELDIDKDSTALAKYYYYTAFKLNPINGMPLNQLGTLYTKQDKYLQAVLFYMQCKICDEPFDRVENNLKQGLAKYNDCTDEITKHFLHILKDFNEESGERWHDDDDLVTTFVDHFVVEDTNPDLLYDFISVELLVIAQMKKNESSKLNDALNIFGKTLLKFLTLFQSIIEDNSQGRKSDDESKTEDVNSEEDDKNTPNLRRRKLGGSNSSDQESELSDGPDLASFSDSSDDEIIELNSDLEEDSQSIEIPELLLPWMNSLVLISNFFTGVEFQVEFDTPLEQSLRKLFTVIDSLPDIHKLHTDVKQALLTEHTDFILPEDTRLEGFTMLDKYLRQIYQTELPRKCQQEILNKIRCIRLLKLRTGLSLPEGNNKDALGHKMGKLRMIQELALLDSNAWKPVFVLPDCQVMLNRIGLVRRIIEKDKLVCIVGDEVMRKLDSLKATSPQARDAIKNLEQWLMKASRFVRVQKPEEKKDVEKISKDNELQNVDIDQLHPILEAGANLCTKVTHTTMACVLTQYSKDDLEQLGELIKVQGLSVDNIDCFMAKLNRSAHKSKRRFHR